jgi:hypothetical protein
MLWILVRHIWGAILGLGFKGQVDPHPPSITFIYFLFVKFGWSNNMGFAPEKCLGVTIFTASFFIN